MSLGSRRNWLFVDAAAMFGGHEVMLLRWIEELASRPDSGVRPRLLARAGSRLHELAPAPTRVPAFPVERSGRLARPWRLWRDALALRRAIRAEQAEWLVFASGALGSQVLAGDAGAAVGRAGAGLCAAAGHLRIDGLPPGLAEGPVRAPVLRAASARLGRDHRRPGGAVPGLGPAPRSRPCAAEHGRPGDRAGAAAGCRRISPATAGCACWCWAAWRPGRRGWTCWSSTWPPRRPSCGTGCASAWSARGRTGPSSRRAARPIPRWRAASCWAAGCRPARRWRRRMCCCCPPASKACRW